MPIVSGSFVAEAPAELVFRVTLTLEEWPEHNPACKEVTILEAEGLKCRFRMVHSAGGTWESDMWRSEAGLFAFSERHEPSPPIRTMQYLRTYRDIGQGLTEVTETVNFELLAEDAAVAGSIAEGIKCHMAEIHPAIKGYVEKRAREENRVGKPSV